LKQQKLKYLLNYNHKTHALGYTFKLATDRFKCDSACVWWL